MKIENNIELKKYTTFQIGGLAPIVCFPENTEELIQALQQYPDAIVLGNCSDVLISSDGVDKPVILTGNVKDYSIDGNRVFASCGVKAPKLANEVAERGLSGFEFMIGIPGSIGGMVYMNASAHGQSVADTFVSCQVYDIENKTVKTLLKDEMGFAYRKSIASEKRYIVLNVEFELKSSDIDEIKNLMQRNLEFRKQKQPSLALPNAGSVFKNPENDSAGRLLEKAGVKSHIIGGAKVWENHANFIVNIGQATSKDVLNLMKKMKDDVKEKYTIELCPEVKYIGNTDGEEYKLWQSIIE